MCSSRTVPPIHTSFPHLLSTPPIHTSYPHLLSTPPVHTPIHNVCSHLFHTPPFLASFRTTYPHSCSHMCSHLRSHAFLLSTPHLLLHTSYSHLGFACVLCVFLLVSSRVGSHLLFTPVIHAFSHTAGASFILTKHESRALSTRCAAFVCLLTPPHPAPHVPPLPRSHSLLNSTPPI